MVVIVCGLPGSGKSYFASQLARQMNAEYLNTDKVRLEMYAARTYSEEEKRSVYNRLLALAGQAVSQNRSVIIDGTFYTEQIRNIFRNYFNEVVLYFIEIRAEESVIRERLNKPREFSEADFSVYEKIRSQWEPITGEHLGLQSTDSNINEMLTRATAWLHTHHRPDNDQ